LMVVLQEWWTDMMLNVTMINITISDEGKDFYYQKLGVISVGDM
jgi:hypothetical protein